MFEHHTLLIGVLLLCFSSVVLGWSEAHVEITRCAYERLPEEHQVKWHRAESDPIWKVTRPISEGLIQVFCYYPDTYDCGPDNPTHNPAVRPYLFFQGKSTYHYFTLPTEQENREFYLQGALWYFDQMHDAILEGRMLDAAQYAGALAHATEDRASPYHCMDGYESLRAKYEEQYGVNFRFWVPFDKSVKVSLEDHVPVSLGATPEAAALTFAQRLEELNQACRDLLPAFIEAHLKDDWQNQVAGKETDAVMNQMATASAKLVADMLYTVFEFKPDEAATQAGRP